MPTRSLSAADVQKTLGKLVRDEVKSAAGTDNVLKPYERVLLEPLAKKAADALGTGDLAVGPVVDQAMAEAMNVWRKFNPASQGANAKLLSSREMDRIAADDPEVGRWTKAAAKIVENRGKAAQAAPRVSLISAAPGVHMTKRGDLYTITALASVPVGTRIDLVVDSHRLSMVRNPGGLTAYQLEPPKGYGLEETASVHGQGDLSTTLRITKDSASSLSQTAALTKARAGIIEYLKTTRMHDDDWKSYFPEDWDQAVAQGILQGIQTFASPGHEATEVIRKPDSYVFVGRGPFDLYTEVEVAKKDGKILKAYVEID